MQVGMLWFDDGSAKLRERVERAADYYADKYGHKPNLCLVHPKMLSGGADKFGGVQVRSGSGVMPGHFWLGVEEGAKTNGKNGGKNGSKASAKKATKSASTRKSTSNGKSGGKSKAKSSKGSAKRKSKKKAD